MANDFEDVVPLVESQLIYDLSLAESKSRPGVRAIRVNVCRVPSVGERRSNGWSADTMIVASSFVLPIPLPNVRLPHGSEQQDFEHLMHAARSLQAEGKSVNISARIA